MSVTTTANRVQAVGENEHEPLEIDRNRAAARLHERVLVAAAGAGDAVMTATITRHFPRHPLPGPGTAGRARSGSPHCAACEVEADRSPLPWPCPTYTGAAGRLLGVVAELRIDLDSADAVTSRGARDSPAGGEGLPTDLLELAERLPADVWPGAGDEASRAGKPGGRHRGAAVSPRRAEKPRPWLGSR